MYGFRYPIRTPSTASSSNADVTHDTKRPLLHHATSKRSSNSSTYSRLSDASASTTSSTRSKRQRAKESISKSAKTVGKGVQTACVNFALACAYPSPEYDFSSHEGAEDEYPWRWAAFIM